MLAAIMNINLGTSVAFVVLFHTRQIKMHMLSPSSTQLTMLDTSRRNVSRVEIQHWVGEGEQQRFLKRVAVTNTRLDLHNSSYHTQLHSMTVHLEQVKE